MAADRVEDAKKVADKVGGGVRSFSDPDLQVSLLWKAGVAGDSTPTPATYVLAKGGAVLFEHHATDEGDWPKVEDVLSRLP